MHVDDTHEMINRKIHNALMRVSFWRTLSDIRYLPEVQR